MKRKYIFFVFCLRLSSLVDAQDNYTVEYNTVYKTFSKDDQRMPKENKRINMVYTQGDSLSFSSGGTRRENKRNSEVGKRYDNHMEFYFPKFSRTLRVNYIENPPLLLEYENKNIDWTLYSDTMTIAGYLCKVAVGEEVIAWYASSLPVPFGPNQFRGLPGMVLLVESRGAYVFYIKAVSVKKRAPHIVLPKAKIIPIKDGESKIEEMKKYFED